MNGPIPESTPLPGTPLPGDTQLQPAEDLRTLTPGASTRTTDGAASKPSPLLTHRELLNDPELEIRRNYLERIVSDNIDLHPLKRDVLLALHREDDPACYENLILAGTRCGLHLHQLAGALLFRFQQASAETQEVILHFLMKETLEIPGMLSALWVSIEKAADITFVQRAAELLAHCNPQRIAELEALRVSIEDSVGSLDELISDTQRMLYRRIGVKSARGIPACAYEAPEDFKSAEVLERFALGARLCADESERIGLLRIVGLLCGATNQSGRAHLVPHLLAMAGNLAGAHPVEAPQFLSVVESLSMYTYLDERNYPSGSIRPSSLGRALSVVAEEKPVGPARARLLFTAAALNPKLVPDAAELFLNIVLDPNQRENSRVQAVEGLDLLGSCMQPEQKTRVLNKLAPLLEERISKSVLMSEVVLDALQSLSPSAEHTATVLGDLLTAGLLPPQLRAAVVDVLVKEYAALSSDQRGKVARALAYLYTEPLESDDQLLAALEEGLIVYRRELPAAFGIFVHAFEGSHLPTLCRVAEVLTAAGTDRLLSAEQQAKLHSVLERAQSAVATLPASQEREIARQEIQGLLLRKAA